MSKDVRPSAPWLALAVLVLGVFMTLLDLTIVNVAPSIVDDLHASLDQILRGTSLNLPDGIPAQVAQQIQQVAHAVFTQAFVDAMRPPMALAIGVILLAAIGALWARNRPSGAQGQTERAARAEEAAVA